MRTSNTTTDKQIKNMLKDHIDAYNDILEHKSRLVKMTLDNTMSNRSANMLKTILKHTKKELLKRKKIIKQIKLNKKDTAYIMKKLKKFNVIETEDPFEEPCPCEVENACKIANTNNRGGIQVEALNNDRDDSIQEGIVENTVDERELAVQREQEEERERIIEYKRKEVLELVRKRQERVRRVEQEKQRRILEQQERVRRVGQKKQRRLLDQQLEQEQRAQEDLQRVQEQRVQELRE
jgi:hypothetical protein